MIYRYYFIEPLHKLIKLVVSLSPYYKLGTQDIERLSTLCTYLKYVIYQGSLCSGLFHYEIHTLHHRNILLDLF